MARMREWFIEADEFEFYDDFRTAVERELAGLENMGHRLGRGFVVTPVRRPKLMGTTEVYETVGWAFAEVVMPAVREAAPPAEEPAEDVPDELSAGELAEHFPEPAEV